MIRPGRRTVLAICLCIAAGALGFSLVGCGSKGKQRHSLEGVPVVRVRIFEAQDRVTLKATDTPFATLSGDSTPRKVNVNRGDSVTVELAPDGWRIGGTPVGSGELTLSCETEGGLKINGSAYRGKYRLVPVAPGKFDVVNDVDIDSYLRGVVPKEMLRNWHAEAYRAQAIVARTYALYEWRTASNNGTRHFDLYADVRSQVYGGMDAERSDTSDAVDATEGIVVAAGDAGNERIFKAYFSSCCGGVRQSSADAFGEPHPAMEGMSVGALCNASPRFSWPTISVRKDELTRRLKLWGKNRGRSEANMAMLVSIAVQVTNPFGRPVRFVVTDAKGSRYSLNGEEIRWAVNTGAPQGQTLNSSFFQPINTDQTVDFSNGHGWGHGVGLCQWCAQSQAEQGMRHEDIVLSAFNNSRLLRAY